MLCPWYNKYGDAYWIVVLDIDCAHAVDGWFEVTARFVHVLTLLINSFTGNRAIGQRR